MDDLAKQNRLFGFDLIYTIAALRKTCSRLPDAANSYIHGFRRTGDSH